MNTYLLLKSLHILGVIIFLGNITVTGWWKTMADKTRNPTIIAFAQRQVTLTDFVFTLTGVILILITGIGNAVLHNMDYFSINWLSWGFWLFFLSGVIWLFVLVPLQMKMAKMAKEFIEGEEIPELYWELSKIWLIFGILATLIPLANLYWMVFKPV